MAKVFINHVDQYFGRNVGKVISNAFVGATLDAADDEEKPKSPKYNVSGTLKDPDAERPDWVSDTVQHSSDDEQLLASLLSFDVIIYDIVEDLQQTDECRRAITVLHSALDKIKDRQVVFICSSNILSWGRSPPILPEDPEEPFVEEDYRRRKPHIHYKPQTALEKLVIKLGKTDKSKLMTYTVCCGLTFGCGESVFHPFFKLAWHNEEELPCFAGGHNFLPTIHIKDLGCVMVNIADARPKTRYIIAVDEGMIRLEDIVRAISNTLGSGKVKSVPKEEGIACPDMRQVDYDQILLSTRMTATCITDTMTMDWVAQTGIVDSIQSVVKEYREQRNLQPLRVCVLGPPGVGKTTIVEKLCKFYKLHHIKMATVIDENMDKLQRSAARATRRDLSEDDDAQAQRDKELLTEIKDSTKDKENQSGRYPDQYINSFFRDILSASRCQNQGFILDGYPKTYEQAKELFQAVDDDDDSESAKAPRYNKLIMPDVVISLDASDEFLLHRVMSFPEDKISEDPRYEEKAYKLRLATFRELNKEDRTVLNYFDELEIHPDHVDVEADQSPTMKNLIKQLRSLIGEPHNYGPTPEELAERLREEAEERMEREESARIEREEKERIETEEREQRESEWEARFADVHRQEEEALAVATVPLRNYLMQHIMPVLNSGLIEAVRTRPEDPVDFLAEYLFKNNPIVD